MTAVGLATAAVVALLPAAASAATSGSVHGFSYGELQANTVGKSGCGTNVAGEPAIHVSKANLVGLGSENGVGGGSVYWTGTQRGGSAARACSLRYDGQPNAVNGVGASGGDIDTAFAPVKSSAKTYRIYTSSLNLGSINVATSTDNGKTWSQTPVQAGIPVDDREWIAAYGANTSLLTYHDIVTSNIDVLRSDNGGQTYTQVSQAIPATDYKSGNNELGNLVIDHNSGTGSSTSNFYAYQSFVAPSTSSGSAHNEGFLAVSADGGKTWTDKPIPCSTKWGGSLDHNFPNVSVAPNGQLWYAVSNNTSIFTATSSNHGASWNCSGRVSTNTAQAIFPWLVATNSGVNLVYYGAPTKTKQTWYVYFAQHLGSTWRTPKQLMSVHKGAVCEGGASCTSGRQLLDDFGIDTDQSGWAHVAYSHDGPSLGGAGSFTGYAVQNSGTRIGAPN